MKDNFKTYGRLDNDRFGGMTPTGNIIRDGGVLGVLPEAETCAGWTVRGIEDLYEKVKRAWEQYGHLVSNLPPKLRERHQRIYSARVQGLGKKDGILNWTMKTETWGSC